jgi:PAS domain S-box-containing protein
LLVALVGVWAVNRQYATALAGATQEAENVARTLSFLLSHSQHFSESAQEMILHLHRTEKRDVVLVDPKQIILADAVPTGIGQGFTEDPEDEVGATLRDGKVRTFVEISADSPLPIRQIVVPAFAPSGEIMGAVVLEYTSLYDELMQSTRSTVREVAWATLGCVILAALISFYLGHSISKPIRQLIKGATAFAAGETDWPKLAPREDEIGDLAMAFQNMVQKRRQTEEELRQARGELEKRVEDRTKELTDLQALYYSLVEQMPIGVFRKDASNRFVLVNSWFCEAKGRKADLILGRTAAEISSDEGHKPGSKWTMELAKNWSIHHDKIMRTGQVIEVEEKYESKDGSVQYLRVVKSPVFAPNGKVIVGTQGLVFDVTERKRAEEELSYERELLRALLDNSPDHIYFKDAQSRFIKSSKDLAVQFGLASADELVGKTDFDFFTEEHARPAYEDEQEIIRTGRPIIGRVEKEAWKDGRQDTWVLTNKMPFRNKAGEIIGTMGISRDISNLKNTEFKLEQVHKQLLDASRRAGMAEIATNVLHNIGNVLNSVNISAGLVMDSLKKSKVSALAKIVALLRDHEHDLGGFFTNDPKGKQVPIYLAQLSEYLLADQKTCLQELESLSGNMEHVKEIVAMQQSYATFGGVKEMINMADLVEDSIRINEESLRRHGIEVVREFDRVPLINTEKHKILQILVNLLRNAKHACQDSKGTGKRLMVQVTHGDGRIKVSVTDNGIGIPPENLTSIFNHGFTTRKDGHGFGLHSGALTAKELGGSLKVQSDGLGRGATFTLELPAGVPSAPVIQEVAHVS